MANLAFWNLAIPAPKRLAMMRAGGRDWKRARAYSHGSYAAAHGLLSQGSEGPGRPIWYTHGGSEFRNERQAREIVSRLPLGWYTDVDACDTATGIVAGLSHGRYIAGYLWTSNGERVYFPRVYDDERDAAYAADSHAEQFADSAREDSERFNAMQLAEFDVENKTLELQKAIALRHRAKFGGFDRVRDAIETLHQAREALRETTAAYERG